MISEAMMIVPYQWILNMVEKKTKTIASKMILFRGERVFRLCLKNHAKSAILLFLTADLNRIGMRVVGVTYGIEDADTCPATMKEMKRENKIGIDGSLQLFTANLDKMVTRQRTFVFRIRIKGTDPGYSYQLSDRLAKDQLWAAKENPNLADVEFVVKGEKLFANKAILAARSEVFAAEFSKEQPVKEGRHQIRIDGVQPSIVEQFLHFIYTGEPISSLANEQLLKLAVQYQLKILISLCQVALKKIETIQMVNFMTCVNMEGEKPSSSKIRPEKDTEIFFDRTTPTFRCTSSWNKHAREESKCVMQYNNKDIFFAYFNNKDKIRGPWDKHSILFRFSWAKRHSFGLKIQNIYFKSDDILFDSDGIGSEYPLSEYALSMPWHKMESKNEKNAELPYFTAQSRLWLSDLSIVKFDIKVVSTVNNYYYEMMDYAWLKDFWTAATNQKLTDVEIFVGTVKVMEVHRVILCARSFVLSNSLNKISNATKSIVYFSEELDVNTVKHFLQFLYTGSLETSASKDTNFKQLLKLATMYEVETLKNLCQLIGANPPDVEDLTNSLLEL